jgi:hypothetical protein
LLWDLESLVPGSLLLEVLAGQISKARGILVPPSIVQGHQVWRPWCTDLDDPLLRNVLEHRPTIEFGQ